MGQVYDGSNWVELGPEGAEWARTDTGREAKFYTLTPAGVKQLKGEVASWTRYVDAMSRVLGANGPAT